jgi:hypothetical protein
MAIEEKKNYKSLPQKNRTKFKHGIGTKFNEKTPWYDSDNSK